MLFPLKTHILRLASMLYKLSSSIQPVTIPSMFEAFASFLEKEPINNFSYNTVPDFNEPIPLAMNKKAQESLRIHLKDFPDRIESGEGGIDLRNFLYYLGQSLIIVSLVLTNFWLFDKGETDPEKKRKIEDAAKKLYKVWLNESQMNTDALFRHYTGWTNQATKEHLVERLHKSAEISKNEILPLFSENKPE